MKWARPHPTLLSNDKGSLYGFYFAVIACLHCLRMFVVLASFNWSVGPSIGWYICLSLSKSVFWLTGNWKWIISRKVDFFYQYQCKWCLTKLYSFWMERGKSKNYIKNLSHLMRTDSMSLSDSIILSKYKKIQRKWGKRVSPARALQRLSCSSMKKYAIFHWGPTGREALLGARPQSHDCCVL